MDPERPPPRAIWVLVALVGFGLAVWLVSIVLVSRLKADVEADPQARRAASGPPAPR